MMPALAQQAVRLHGETLRPLLRRRMRPGAPVSHGAAHRHEGGVFGAGAPMHAAAVAAAISALTRKAKQLSDGDLLAASETRALEKERAKAETGAASDAARVGAPAPKTPPS